ncbi:MAG: hypothetical protein QGF90_13715 [Gammaproteobacteria bacterium]|jgi:hypothetical protein|nr:hypothetical protein [Gammaproteobacteria bacterium]|tara:strand:- start:760 stop:1509 length:750 start_codon:yes stop_codon:yes gene_type:complete
MLSCESCQYLIADALYEQIDARLEQQMLEHLESCADCQSMQQELLAAQAQLRDAGLSSGHYDDIPERAALDGIWDRIEPTLDKIDAQRYSKLPRRNLTPWVAAITAIAASVVVFFSVNTPQENDQTLQPQIVSTAGVSPDLMNYLDRAQVMLMQVANTESNNGSVIPITNTFARNMAFEANFLGEVSDNDVNSAQRKLLKDIEFLLLQVANLDESNLEDGVILLQRFLEENSILFRIRLLEMKDQSLVI